MIALAAWQLRTLATAQFSNFKFEVGTSLHTVFGSYIHFGWYLLSILLLVVPESSYFYSAESSSLLIAWSLNCSSGAISSKLTVASFKTPTLKEKDAEMDSCSAPPSSHGLLLTGPQEARKTCPAKFP